MPLVHQIQQMAAGAARLSNHLKRWRVQRHAQGNIRIWKGGATDRTMWLIYDPLQLLNYIFIPTLYQKLSDTHNQRVCLSALASVSLSVNDNSYLSAYLCVCAPVAAVDRWSPEALPANSFPVRAPPYLMIREHRKQQRKPSARSGNIAWWYQIRSPPSFIEHDLAVYSVI